MASGIHTWKRSAFNFQPDSTTPIKINNLTLWEAPAGATLLRTILDIELYVTVFGTGTGFSLLWWQNVNALVGVWWDDSAVIPATSPTPFTNPEISPEWVLWNGLQATPLVYDTGSPTEDIVWRLPGGRLDVSGKRAAAADTHNTLWLSWEMIDPTGVINTTFGSMNYYLGANYHISSLYKLAA